MWRFKNDFQKKTSNQRNKYIYGVLQWNAKLNLLVFLICSEGSSNSGGGDGFGCGSGKRGAGLVDLKRKYLI